MFAVVSSFAFLFVVVVLACSLRSIGAFLLYFFFAVAVVVLVGCLLSSFSFLFVVVLLSWSVS